MRSGSTSVLLREIVAMKELLFVPAVAVATLVGAAHASDVVMDWNSMYLQGLRQGPFNGPGPMARTGALMHTAIFNAVNAIDQTHVSYGGFQQVAAPGTSKKAAVAYAAHRVLTQAYPQPGLVSQFDAQLSSSIAGLSEVERSLGQALGHAAADHIIAQRTNDGSSNFITYTPGTNPGDWRPTQAGDPVTPHWGNTTPWGLNSGSQFRPNRLSSYGTLSNFLASQEYADNYNDVKENGRVDRWTPADEEYQIAFFWGNDRGGTYHPPGHLNAITQTMAERQFAGLSEDDRISQSARLFGLLNLAMADAGVAAWDCKYNTELDLWRPITGIREADTDGNPLTISDPAWEPLNHVDPDGAGPMQADPFSPNFPAYMSGHATFGAAHSAIMREFFGGSDLIEGGLLEIGTDDPYVPGLTRTFSSWEAMARENGRSRVYLGVHWQIDADDGYTTGDSVGQWIFDNYLRAVPTPGAFATFAAAGVFGLRRRRN